MSRQQRRYRVRLPEQLWADPDAYLREVFGDGYEQVTRPDEIWCVQVGGRLYPLGTSVEVKDPTQLQARLHRFGLLAADRFVPLRWPRRVLLPTLRRSLTLQQQGATR